MKKFIGFFALMSITVFSYSQEIQQKNVPAVILNAFQLKFSNATDIEWKLDNGNYKVNFEMNDKDNELLMNDKGTIIKHNQDLYISEIPKPVLEAIRSKVAFFDVNYAERIDQAGKITYNIDLEINDKKNEFIIDESGRLLNYIKELKSSDIPLQIIDMIRTKFGSLDMDGAWFLEEKGKVSYKIRGEIDDKDHSFIMDDKGKILKHEQDMRISEIPVLVLNSVKSTYSGYELKDAQLLEEAGNTIYNIELRKNREKIIVTSNSEGKIMVVKNK